MGLPLRWGILVGMNWAFGPVSVLYEFNRAREHIMRCTNLIKESQKFSEKMFSSPYNWKVPSMDWALYNSAIKIICGCKDILRSKFKMH